MGFPDLFFDRELFGLHGAKCGHVQRDHIVRDLVQQRTNNVICARGFGLQWVRLEGVRALSVIADISIPSDWITDEMAAVSIGGLLKQAVERLDKVRLSGCQSLIKWVQAFPNTMSSQSRERFSVVFTDFPDAFWSSAIVYYSRMVRLLGVDEFRSAMWEGYVLSAGGAGESLVSWPRRAWLPAIDARKLRAANRALTQFLDTLSTEELETIMDSLVTVVERKLQLDRVVVSAFEVIASLFSEGILARLEDTSFRFASICTLAQKAIFKSRNVPKTLAVVKVFAGLANMEETRAKAVERLVAMLLHPFPRIRSAAADALYLVLSSEEMETDEAEEVVMSTDWMVPTQDLKDPVAKLKGLLL